MGKRSHVVHSSCVNLIGQTSHILKTILYHNERNCSLECSPVKNYETCLVQLRCHQSKNPNFIVNDHVFSFIPLAVNMGNMNEGYWIVGRNLLLILLPRQ